MFILQVLKPFSSPCLVDSFTDFPSLLTVSPHYSCSNFTFRTRSRWDHIKRYNVSCGSIVKSFPCLAVSSNSDSPTNSENSSGFKVKPKRKSSLKNAQASENIDDNPENVFPTTIPRKPRRGRKSEAVAVEDFVRDSLERTFTSIRQQNLDGLENMESVMKDKEDEMGDCGSSDDDHEDIEEEEEDDDDDDDENVAIVNGKRKKMVVEEESRNWPLDADVGWGIRASEYFEQHGIKNTVGEDGIEIDWEGEIENNWVKEINCLEWESFAFHPSPLIVLVFERYNRAAYNWKILKELEKAAQVFWSAKDRLPPRTVKIDINIEKDLAYALKVKDCPQILFLRGNRILYREQEFRTADEIVHMIAHFYYNAKKPSCMKN